MNGRIVITGTGRAGTTLLVQLLTHLGEDTGFASDLSRGYFEKARAGLEWHLSDYPNLPEVIKGPHFCDQIDEMLTLGITISHVIIPVRNFADAAASRRHVQHETIGSVNGWGTPGGLWSTERGADQEAVIRQKFTTLMESVVRNDIPATYRIPSSYRRRRISIQQVGPRLSALGARRLRHSFQGCSEAGNCAPQVRRSYTGSTDYSGYSGTCTSRPQAAKRGRNCGLRKLTRFFRLRHDA